MTRQLRLAWPPQLDFTPESFVASGATREAREALAGWREWPSRALALVGPEGAGKSHLAAIWAGEAGGAGEDRPVLVEDADRTAGEGDEMALFRLLEQAAAHEIPAVLLTARRRPADWGVSMPDLASRLRALAFVELEAPDDAALSQILRKLLRDRHLRVDDRVIDYVVKRIERSAPAARRAADLLDRAASEQGRNVTMRLASEVFAAGEFETDDEGLSA